MVNTFPLYDDYAQKADREIPIVLLERTPLVSLPTRSQPAGRAPERPMTRMFARPELAEDPRWRTGPDGSTGG
jgi:hypothetical protein